MRNRVLNRFELALLVVGTILIATYLAVRVEGGIRSRLALMAFHATQHTTAATELAQGDSLPIDFRLWSENRITAYKKLIGSRLPAPLAVLSIPRLGLEVPVFEGVDAVTLNRGAGRIPGTARVGSTGNLGIAAHRDGFFRVLKDIAIGDTLELQLPDTKQLYIVTSFEIVSPADVTVLAPSCARPLL